jgi:hypothetical protein
MSVIGIIDINSEKLISRGVGHLKKQTVIKEVNGILDLYCDNCLLYKYNRSELGKRKAHRFCIKQCSVGKKLQNYGKQLI